MKGRLKSVLGEVILPMRFGVMHKYIEFLYCFRISLGKEINKKLKKLCVSEEKKLEMLVPVQLSPI